MEIEINQVRVRLPVGYRFDPTDDILVDAYLKRRVFNQPLPAEFISEFNVFQAEPWMLPKGDEKLFTDRQYYFFNTRGRDLESLDRRAAGSGEWSMSERGKDIPIPGNNQVIGKRNTLIFWDGARRTKWVMHEFRLALIAQPTKMANLAVYRIFEKKDAKRARNSSGARNYGRGGRNSARAEVIDLNAEAGSGTFSGPPPMTPSMSECSE